MNIAASNAQSNAAPSRTDAATATDLPAADDAAAGDSAQNFGQILSVTVSKGTAPPMSAELKDGRTLNLALVDPKFLPSSKDDVGATAATADQPILLDLNAILGGRIDARKGAETDAPIRSKQADEADESTDDQSSAQLALLTQSTWHAIPARASAGDDASPLPRGALSSTATVKAAVDATAGARSVTPESGPVDADVAKAAVIEMAATQGVVEGAVPAIAALAVPAASRGRPSIDAMGAVTRDETARAAPPVGASHVDAVRTNPDSAKPGEAARPVTAVDASSLDVASAKQPPVKSDEATRLATAESTTAAMEKVFGLAVAGASPVVTDPASIANQFLTQVAAHVSSVEGSLANVATVSAAALREPVATPAWSHELGQAAIRMASDDLQHASLRLNPEHLGPLDVQMRIDNGVAHMQFAAAHAETRVALEGSRATLDQMFADQGLKLGDWSVGNSSSNASFARQFGSASSQGESNGSSTGEGDMPDGGTTVAMRATRPLGLVDTFA